MESKKEINSIFTRINNIEERLKTIQINKVVAFKISKIAWAIFRTLLLIGMGYVILYPLLSMISKAFSGDYIRSATVVWIPKKFTLENIQTAMKFLKYRVSLFNTMELGIVSAILQIISCSLAGYGFARYKFKGREILFGMVIFTIIVPPQTYIIPTYIKYHFFNFFGIGNILKLFGLPGTVNLINTDWTFWLPSMFGMGLRSGLFIYIFRQFFRGLSKELEDAAKIDGCNALTTYFRIMLPNALPACLTVFLFSFVWHWNDYYLSNMMFQIKNEPLSVLIFREHDFARGLSGYNVDNYDMKYMLNASVLLTIAPVLILYIFAQRYFIESVDKVGVKG